MTSMVKPGAAELSLHTALCLICINQALHVEFLILLAATSDP